MKFSFRATLTTILISLLTLTVSALGYSSYRNVRFIAEDLTDQILDQTSRLIDDEINDLLRTASDQSRINLRMIQSSNFDLRDFHRLSQYWMEVLSANPRVTRLSIGVEATGEWFYVDRPNGHFSIGGLRLNPSTGHLDLAEFRAEDFPDKPFYAVPNKDELDARNRPWYVAARRLGRETWSETYVLLSGQREEDVPGITCSTPIYKKDGTLFGVLGASFDVVELSMYLRGLKVGDDGYAFVVECREDGTRQVIAHKDPTILTRMVERSPRGRGLTRELMPSRDLRDREAVQFLNLIPEGLKPSELREPRRIAFDHQGVRYLGTYSCLSSQDTPDWLICIIMPASDVMGRVEQNSRFTAAIGLAVLLVAILIALYVSTQVARPLERVAEVTEEIGRFRLEAKPVAHSVVREVDRLAIAVEETKASLRSFRKYVPADLIRSVLATRQEAGLGGERRTMTISFCDLANFTTLAEQLSPEDLLRHLGDYFDPLSSQILASGGTVDKYIGDAIMAFWGAPAPNPNHAIAACTAALQNQAALAELRPRWAAQGMPELHARIGIHTGEVIVGNIGCLTRLNYTVVGDAVNVASRLESLGKSYGTSILIGEPTYKDARSAVIARAVDCVSVKGKHQGLRVYELLALREEGTPELERLETLADEALELYLRQDWEGAILAYREILELRPDDGPAGVIIARCHQFQDDPPVEDWDGVHRMTSK